MNNYEQKVVVITIKTCKEDWVVLKCDRGGECVNVLNLTVKMRQRETHTRLTRYDFKIVCSSVKGV